MEIVRWTTAIALFWVVSAMFLGGAPMRIRPAGALRELGALLLSFAAYLAVWRLLLSVTGTFLPEFVDFLAATVVSAPAVPLLQYALFRALGVRFEFGGGEH